MISQSTGHILRERAILVDLNRSDPLNHKRGVLLKLQRAERGWSRRWLWDLLCEVEGG